MDKHIQLSPKFYTTWTNATTFSSILILLVFRLVKHDSKIKRVIVSACQVFLVNAIAVGVLGAFSLAYKKDGIPAELVTLKLRSNFWQHAIPSLVATGILVHQKEKADWKYLFIVPVMQLLYALIPYQGTIAFQKLKLVYGQANPIMFFGVADVVVLITGLTMKFQHFPRF